MTDTATLQAELARLQAIRANSASAVREADGRSISYDLAAVARRIREIEIELAGAADPTGILRPSGPRYLVARFPE